MKTFSNLLVLLLAIAATTLAAPLATEPTSQRRQFHAAKRQTDNFNTAVAGPPGAGEIGWLFGSLVIAWALTAIGILVLRKRRQDHMEKRESLQQETGSKEWEDTYKTMT